MSTVRLRRLAADFEKLREYVGRHPRLQLIQTEGDPPERYQLEYRVRSLRQRPAGGFDEVSSHIVEIALPRHYPRVPPQCRMLTPVFHPNIAPHAICIGDHWSAGEPLSSIVMRIGEMLAYQSYNVKSPLNGEAARWVNENLQRLPLDPVNMLPEDPGPAGNVGAPASAAVAAPASAPPAGDGGLDLELPPDLAAPPAPAPVPEPAPIPVPQPPPAPVPAAGPLLVACPGCSAKLRVPADKAGQMLQCPRCRAVMSIPGARPGQG